MASMMKKKHIRIEWRIIVVFLVLIVVPGVIIANRFISKNSTYDQHIALVNGFPISTKEFDNAIEANRARIIDYFYKTYGAEEAAGFWTTSFEGETPAELAMNKALEDVVAIKIRQLIAKEQGVLQDISYKSFVRQLNEENKRRQSAIRNREIVYGPRQYEEKAYFEYWLSNVTRSVKNQLMMGEWKPTEQQLKQFYDLHKNQLYTSQGSVKVELLSLSFLNANQAVDEALKKDAEKIMKDARAMAASKKEFEDIAKSFDTDLHVMEKVFDLRNVRSNLRSPVAQAAEKLSEGEMSGIIEENGRFYFIRCIETQEEGSGLLNFDDINEQILKDFGDFKYEEYVRKRITEAEIELNETVYLAYSKM